MVISHECFLGQTKTTSIDHIEAASFTNFYSKVATNTLTSIDLMDGVMRRKREIVANASNEIFSADLFSPHYTIAPVQHFGFS